MRSTAFTSLLALLPALAAAEAAIAGCLARVYDAVHLASQPAQVVARLSLRIDGPVDAVGTSGELVAVLADQGRAREAGLGGAALAQPVFCYEDAASPVCGVDCDGGLARLETASDGALLLTTNRLLMGSACDVGGFDLVERVGEAVTYRLLPGACG